MDRLVKTVLTTAGIVFILGAICVVYTYSILHLPAVIRSTIQHNGTDWGIYLF